MQVKRAMAIVAGMLLTAALLAPVAFAGKGNGPQGRGRCNGDPTWCRQQNPDCPGNPDDCPKDGSCRKNRRGDCPGPRDGSGPRFRGGAAPDQAPSGN